MSILPRIWIKVHVSETYPRPLFVDPVVGNGANVRLQGEGSVYVSGWSADSFKSSDTVRGCQRVNQNRKTCSIPRVVVESGWGAASYPDLKQSWRTREVPLFPACCLRSAVCLLFACSLWLPACVVYLRRSRLPSPGSSWPSLWLT